MSTEGLQAQALIQLHPRDKVAVACVAVAAGAVIAQPGGPLAVPTAIPAGHKIAIVPIAAGEVVLKYGQPIGVASRPIAAGEHVHVHNVEMGQALPSQAIHLSLIHI